jgi:ectoine hydrolase
MSLHFMIGLWRGDWGFEIAENIRIGTDCPKCLADVPRNMVLKD